MQRRTLIGVSAIALVSMMAIHTGEAWARAGGGGSRGSRSYSAPARPAPTSPGTPSSPSRNLNQPAPAQQPFAPQRPSFFRGMMGAVAGFAIGGLIGSLLFGGLGHGLGGFGGIGLFDILLIGGGIVLLMMYLRRRREAASQPAYAGATAYGRTVAPDHAPSGYGTAGATVEMPAGQSDLDRGLDHIRQMDATFDPEAFAFVAKNTFLEVQQAVAARDVAWLRDRLTPEMYSVLSSQSDRLRSARQTNHIERIQVRRADITEAWQESGRDFVTVYLEASLLDYTVDDATGGLVDGSKTMPQDVQEFWTFTRPVGRNAWQLSAIQGT